MKLTFEALEKANQERVSLFRNAAGQSAGVDHLNEWSVAEWSNAFAGECGEACNIAKKLRRGDFGAPGSVEYSQAAALFVTELADAVIYADLAAQRVGLSLGEFVRMKFNLVSERHADTASIVI